MTKLILNMIVRNEAGRIERALLSAAPHISCYAIVDTGSSDGTVQLIKSTFDALGIPGTVSHATFHDFSQARNEGLRAAFALNREWDYVLLMDADMELRVKDKTWVDSLSGPSYDMYQTSGSLTYQNRRLLSRKLADAHYLGVTHEYLNTPTAGCIPAEAADFYDHADGANRPDKFKRDIALLKAGLKKEPNNERYFFYLAQSYRDAGEPAKAAKWYQRRVQAGGWDEEVWCAQQKYAQCLLDMGDEAGFIREMLIAYNMRPSRAETLYDLAKHYRLDGKQTLGALFAEIGMRLPRSKDALFVNDYVYDAGLKEELSICAFYRPETRAKGFTVANELALNKTYASARELARNNIYHYLPRIEEFAPSFEWSHLNFEPPADYTAMNPSVTVHRGELVALIRTVNYRITDWGGYIIKATDGTANDSNPIHTRNFLVRLDPSLRSYEHAIEVLPPADMPAPLYKPVIGFEDMRLFSWKDQLWTSSTVREMNQEGYCEQVLARIDLRGSSEAGVRITDVRRMLRTPRLYEKNWMPLVEEAGTRLCFMYRPGEMVDEYGQTYQKNEPAIDTGAFGGGTQLIRFNAGWLGLVHEARIIPGAQRRYYQHRFVFYDCDKKLAKASKPFVFHEKEIEYAAGICTHPGTRDLVISYGFMDKEARIATVDPLEVEEWLWQR